MKPSKGKEDSKEQKEVKPKDILGSRVLPKFIMFDGEGRYSRRVIQGF
jgi:hypothetical protein